MERDHEREGRDKSGRAPRSCIISRFAFSPANSRVFQANSHLTETARVYFVSTRYQKSASGVITYQLLTQLLKLYSLFTGSYLL